MSNMFATVEEAIQAIQGGKMVILIDDEDRENEGDLIIAAEYVTPDVINFMTKHARGLICLPMASAMIDRLNLPMMTTHNRSPYGTAFTVSIEAAQGVSTGISAYDRAKTITTAIDPNTRPEDIVTPGHIFPLCAKDKGVIERQGQTEGSVDLVKLAGLKPAAVICEVMNDNGTMSRRDDLAHFSQKHGILMVTVKDLAAYRIKHDVLVNEIATSRIPTKDHGDFKMTVFMNQFDDSEHFCLSRSSKFNVKDPLVRIHSECITGDVFGSCKCDCGAQLQQSLALISAEGGILVYLRQEGRGLGLANKLKAYALQETGFDTVDANLELGLPIDCRDYAVAYQILKHFGLSKMRLITNNPQKVRALEKYGVTISERISLPVVATDENHNYLKTKKEKLGHFITI